MSGSPSADAFTVRRLSELTEREVGGLADLLIDCVDGGASVSFMHPLSVATAHGFWRRIGAET